MKTIAKLLSVFLWMISFAASADVITVEQRAGGALIVACSERVLQKPCSGDGAACPVFDGANPQFLASAEGRRLLQRRIQEETGLSMGTIRESCSVEIGTWGCEKEWVPSGLIFNRRLPQTRIENVIDFMIQRGWTFQYGGHRPGSKSSKGKYIFIKP